jgi:hypothetical protein
MTVPNQFGAVARYGKILRDFFWFRSRFSVGGGTSLFIEED